LRGQDPAIRAGLARIGGERVIVVAMDRYADGAGVARPSPAAKATRSFIAAHPVLT
jgi:acetyl-CoA carboxylase alpha subunit